MAEPATIATAEALDVARRRIVGAMTIARLEGAEGAEGIERGLRMALAILDDIAAEGIGPEVWGPKALAPGLPRRAERMTRERALVLAAGYYERGPANEAEAAAATLGEALLAQG